MLLLVLVLSSAFGFQESTGVELLLVGISGSVSRAGPVSRRQ